MISFTADAFFRLVARYNADLWPAVAAGTVLALAVIVMAATGRGGGRPVAAILALLWLWTGGVFLGRYRPRCSFSRPASSPGLVCSAPASLSAFGRPPGAGPEPSSSPQWFSCIP